MNDGRFLVIAVFVVARPQMHVLIGRHKERL